ncbi:RHS repeat-associated core domain-containing protein [Micromonospora sp. SL1-18]|uniref:RHS repeat domain-containing protein n=1 Tax=Micromonospora sp. SL1-18 TaxID=3399128 RepID=UPI003A4D5251
MFTALVMLSVTAVAVPNEAAATNRPRPALQRPNPVSGHVAPVRPAPPDAAGRRALTAPPAVTWPKAGSVTQRDGVRIEVLDRAEAVRAGVEGLLLRVSPDGTAAAGAGTGHSTAKVTIDYSTFRYAYGGDWASRLRLVQLPERTELTTANDVTAGTLSADVPISGQSTILAVTGGASGAAGDFSATSLAPSASWHVSDQSGDFNWSYPMDVPPAPAGPEPDITLSYSSGRVDGRTASTNNQVSWVGEGMDFWPGYVERKYVPCADDGVSPKTGDLCWGPDENATLMLDGVATELVRDAATGVWHPKTDDGARVELLTGATNGDNDGEYWRVTGTDGVQYYFGLNRLPGWTSGGTETSSTWTVPVFGNNTGEPCSGSTYAASWCQQAWRWNLDYVVEPQGNASSYWYVPEINYYARNTTSSSLGTATKYTRGGYLSEIRYGQRSNTLFTSSAPYRVLFTAAERCIVTKTFDCTAFSKANAAHWPDVPVDANCDAGTTCTYGTPTFWTRKRLATVTTQSYLASAYQDVESWTLTHSFPASGDGTSPALWLSKISHTGHVGGTASLSDVVLSGIQLPNRVDAIDGRPPLIKWRVSAVTDEVGGQLSVSYSGPDCVAGQTPAPDGNTKRCFPQYWSPDESGTPVLDWFHKYVVTQIAEIDATGGSPLEITSYQYLDAPAWHYDDDPLTPAKYRTWGQWRGYSKVRTLHGDPNSPIRTQTDRLYFRGMDGDKLAAGGTKTVTITDSQGNRVVDQPPLQGGLREETDYTGAGGAVAETELTTSWVRQTASRTRAGITVTAHMVREASKVTRTALDSGGWLTTQTDTSYDSFGMPIQVDDKGDVSQTSDDLCTRTTYARNTSAWLIDFVIRVETVSVGCAATTRRPEHVVSDIRTLYDEQAYGVAPIRGDVTRTEAVASYSGGNPVYVTDSTQSYDSLGRVISEADAAGNATTTAYTPATGGPVTQVTVTNALGQSETTTLNPAWGQPNEVVDANNKRTTAAYDPLGRLTGVWLPGRDKATQSASVTYSYRLRPDGVTAVSTSTLRNDGTYTTSSELYDAQMRPRQTQEPAPGGGRIITDTYYDDRGLVAKENQEYFTSGDPSTSLFVPNNDADIPGQQRTVYDGLERPVAQIFLVHSQERWRNTFSYGGDRENLTPPTGAGAITRITDARDNLVELRQYRGDKPTGSYDSVQYTYTPDGELSSVADASGNIRRYTYDLRGRLVKAEEPDAGTITYTFDDDDQLTSTTDARGTTLAYSYDKLGRKTGEFLGSTSGTKLAEWTWDTLAKGYLTGTVRYVDGKAYRAETTAFDNDYRATGSKITIPDAGGAATKLAGTYTYTAEFNLDGTLKRSSFPAAGGLPAETLLYGYNELGDPTTLHGLTTYVTGTSYTKLGQLQRRSMAASYHVWQRDLYYEDGTNQLSRMLDTRDVAPYTVVDRTYNYDPSGNIVKISDAPSAVDPDTQCFQYDHLQRLTEAWTVADGCANGPTASGAGGPMPYWQSFRYDASGNRTKRVDHATAGGGADVTQTYAYPVTGAARPHAVTAVTTSGGPANGRTDQFDYDASGNTTFRTVDGATQNLSWDAEGRLASVTASGKTSTYLYDAEGNLLVSAGSEGATLYLPDQEVQVSAGGVVSGVRYYSYDGETVATRTSSDLSWLLADPQGTSTVAVNTATQTVSRRYYGPFGDERGGSTGGVFPDGRSFIGGTTDRVTGLTHLGAREYDPRIGRFISVDPLTVLDDPQELHGYSYAANSPVLKSDPAGECWICNVAKKVYKAGAKKVGQGYNRLKRAAARPVHFVKKKLSSGYNKAKRVIGALKRTASRYLKAVKKTISRGLSGLRKAARSVIGKARYVFRRVVRHFHPGQRRAPSRKPDTKPTPKPSPSKGDDGPIRRTTPVDLYVGGNTMGPKPAWREGKEYEVDGHGNIPPFGGAGGLPPNGISVFADRDQAARWTSSKRIWKLPKGSPLPPGFDFYHDGPYLNDPLKSSHHTFYNTSKVKPGDMINAFKGMHWQDDGAK